MDKKKGKDIIFWGKADMENLPQFSQVYHSIPQSTLAENCTVLGARLIANYRVHTFNGNNKNI